MADRFDELLRFELAQPHEWDDGECDCGTSTYLVALEASRSAAAALIYKSVRAWEKWEQGDRAMDPALWELWLLKRPSTGDER